MRKKSYVYEEIIDFVVKQNLKYKSFSASEIDLPIRGKTISSFLYKHSNKKYEGTWTLFFVCVMDSRPRRFKIDFNILDAYEKKFGIKLLKTKTS